MYKGGRVWGTAATYCGEAWEGPSRAGKTMARTWHRAANVKWTAGRTKTTHSTLCQRASRSAGRTASPIWIRNAKEAWMGSTPAALPRTAATAIGRPVAKGNRKGESSNGRKNRRKSFQSSSNASNNYSSSFKKGSTQPCSLGQEIRSLMFIPYPRKLQMYQSHPGEPMLRESQIRPMSACVAVDKAACEGACKDFNRGQKCPKSLKFSRSRLHGTKVMRDMRANMQKQSQERLRLE